MRRFLYAILGSFIAGSAVSLEAQVPPVSSAVSTWMMHHGSSSLAGIQRLTGAVTGPHLKCSATLNTGSEGDPAVADINDDGINEIVVLTYSSSRVMVFRGTDCTLLWTRYLGSSTGWGTPALGELDPSSPGLEVVVSNGGTVYALRGTDGAVLWSRSLGVSYSPATIQDVNGDGVGEVFVVGSSIYALRGSDGATLWSHSGSSSYANVAVADLDGDSHDEVITVASNTLYVLNANDGSTVWTYSVGTQGNPAVADVDGDGFYDVVVVAGNGNVVALRHDGTVIWSWTSGCGSYWGSLNSPTIADVTGDGVKDVLFGCMPSSTGYLYVLRGTDGSVQWSYSGTRSGYQALGRKIGDIDGDGVIEVIVSGARYGSSPHLAVLRGPDGTVAWTYDSDYFEGLSIADVDNDSCMEVVSSGDYSSSRLYVFDSSTPVSGCNVLGEGGDLGAEEAPTPPVSLKVEQVGRGLVRLYVGRELPVSIYSADGRLVVRRVAKGGTLTLRLQRGAYVVKAGSLEEAIVVF